ncbi:MAG: RHS repeat-associated core domain-containing protein [Caldilineaceae bacterium]|nr:RHS repeat-associated core domain-containing protein [Caldilineaceae bacterium]
MNRVPYPGLASQLPKLSLDTVRTARRFTGQQLDGSGLYYFNARYYDPEIGHFISPDTIVPDPGSVFGYNRYMYSLGNPLKFNDPSGHVVERTGGTSACRIFSCGKGIITKLAGERISRALFTVSESIEEPAMEAINFASDPIIRTAAKITSEQYEGTQSIDIGFLRNFIGGAGGRGSLSLARDTSGNLAIISSEGFAGSTPAGFAGISVTVTNAPHIDYLAGTSIQGGGSLDLDSPIGLFVEVIAIPNSEQRLPYQGVSIGGAGTYPDPLIGSIHGSVETSQILRKFEPEKFLDNMQRRLYGTGGQ